MHGEHQHLGISSRPGNFLRRFQPTQLRHGDIKDSHIPVSAAESSPPILRHFGPRSKFPRDAPTSRSRTYPFQDNVVIVSQ